LNYSFYLGFYLLDTPDLGKSRFFYGDKKNETGGSALFALRIPPVKHRRPNQTKRMRTGAHSHDSARPGCNTPLYEISLIIKNRDRTRVSH
jgi:hypothetical protein